MAKKNENKVVDNVYTVTLRVSGKEFKGKGESLLEALTSLGLDYTQVKTKGEIIVNKGDKNHTRVIQLPKLRRYFASKLLMGGLIRDLETLLK